MNIIDYIKTKGTKIPHNKYETIESETEVLEAPKLLYFPMTMHIGAPAEPVVEVGDSVKIGTLLGKKEGDISANIHSSVSGRVKSIEEKDTFRGKLDVVIIENDYKYEEEYLDDISRDLTVEEFVQRIEEAGITGKGGAGFPTHVKYQLDETKTNYLIINGAECEPYSTTDARCMIEYSKELVDIIELIMKIYTIDKTYIGIEDHMKVCKDALNESIAASENSNISVYDLPSIYPQGHEGIQINRILGMEKGKDEQAGDMGIILSNVSTLKAIYDAIIKNETLHKRIVTVTGPMIREPKNLMISLGTPVEHAIEACGGLEEGKVIYINGGPMMGKTFDSLNYPIDKDTTTLLFLKEHDQEDERPCIRCAKCVNQCPVSLQPILISNAARNKDYDLGKELRSATCIQCGICTYICPSKINLLKDIRDLNEKLKEENDE